VSKIVPTMAQRNDRHREPLSAITMQSLSGERRRAFGRGSLVTGPTTRDPVTGERPNILPRPLLPVRRFGVDLYL
jgi:hypothetical protein